MKEVVAKSQGEIDSLEVLESPIPTLQPDSNKVLVRVKAIGLNPVDWKLIKHGTAFGISYPYTPGADLSGTVEKANEQSKFKIGDVVYGLMPFFVEKGTCCEFFLANEEDLCLVPQNASDEEVAALPLVTLTVLQAFKKAKIWPPRAENEGKNILIHAGAGGVGSVGIQIAKICKLKVYTTCSERSQSVCEKLGADVIIDYENQPFEVFSYDYILDVIGGEYELRSMKCIKGSGHYMNVLNHGWATYFGPKRAYLGQLYVRYRKIAQYVVGPHYHDVLVQPDGELLKSVSTYVRGGQLKPIIDKKYAFEQVKEAYKYLETGRVKGKLILTL